MANAFNTLTFRGQRRVRLFFSAPLASGALNTPAIYTIANTDGLGVSPMSVVATFGVLNKPNAVELAVDADLAPGAAYVIGWTNLPFADGSFLTGSAPGALGLTLGPQVNAEIAKNDLDLILYSRDLLHDGSDFVEDPTGDLSSITGRDNYKGAMNRRLGSDGLPWNPAYGTKAEEYVDAPETQAVPFQGAILSQARADDRTKQVAVDIVEDPNEPGDWTFQTTLTPIDGLEPITMNVPNPTNA